jgi:hypothetical protein
MRIALPENTLKAYVPPVPVVPLSPETSKALIDSGVFNQKANHVGWTTPAPAPANLGGPIGRAASGQFAAGLTFQPRSLHKSDDSLMTVLSDVAKQAAPFLEHGETHGVADAVALLSAAPEILASFTNPHQSKVEKFFLYGSSATGLLNIANQIVPVPHAAPALEIVAGIFKVGEQVFITGAREPAAGL